MPVERKKNYNGSQRNRVRILSSITMLFSDSDNGIEKNMRFWRKQICDAVFYFVSFLGFFTYVPSVILSIRENYYQIAIINTILYLTCLFLTFNKKINYQTKAISGSVLFYVVGLVLLFVLGPRGAGSVWLFSTTILVAFMLGNTGALISFIVYSLTLVAFYIFQQTNILLWQDKFGITPDDWIIKGINFILLNLIVVIANAIFIKGFKTLLSRSIETRNASIIGLAKLAEYRDSNTGEHLNRIQNYSALIARELSRMPKYQHYITTEYIEDLYLSSILHDIGKVGIQDAILLKNGPLSQREFEFIKEHPKIGYTVISEIEKNINSPSLYTLAREIALYHHERWDGLGYPAGLKGEEIPLSARITALADVYDALTSKRPYKDAIPHREAVETIAIGRGSQFDPEIVDAFLKISSRFLNEAQALN